MPFKKYSSGHGGKGAMSLTMLALIKRTLHRECLDATED